MEKVFLCRALTGGLVLLVLLAGFARAQEITVRPQPPSPPPPGEFRIEPLAPAERVRIPEQDFRPEPQSTDHAPALIHPLTGKVSTAPGRAVRFGVSVWTGPHEVGSGISRVERDGGVLAAGLTFVWDVQDEGGVPPARR